MITENYKVTRVVTKRSKQTMQSRTKRGFIRVEMHVPPEIKERFEELTGLLNKTKVELFIEWVNLQHDKTKET